MQSEALQQNEEGINSLLIQCRLALSLGPIKSSHIWWVAKIWEDTELIRAENSLELYLWKNWEIKPKLPIKRYTRVNFKNAIKRLNGHYWIR